MNFDKLTHTTAEMRGAASDLDDRLTWRARHEFHSSKASLFPRHYSDPRSHTQQMRDRAAIPEPGRTARRGTLELFSKRTEVDAPVLK